MACDDNYSKHAGVVIASILKNADKTDYLHFYILDGGITAQNKDKILQLREIKECEINFVTIDDKIFADYVAVQTHSYITLPAYYRLKIASLLPNVDRIIYFDCDVVVNSSLAELFYTDMNSLPVAGVRDINRKMLKKNPSYINSGMLLIDVKNIRENNIEQLFLGWTKENFKSITCGDQEIINEALRDRIKIVDDKWNVQSSNFINRSSYMKNPLVVHFVARRKPWHWASFSYHRDLYFKYLQLTPWKLSEEEYKHWTKDNQIASLVEYFVHRPTFFLRLRFYEAVIKTYLINGGE